MNDVLIYTDCCSEFMEKEIAKETGSSIIKRMNESDWSINNTMSIITIPQIELAIINKLDSVSLMEISLLNFMCKPILVTTETINQYPLVYNSVDYVDGQCSLIRETNSFIKWYKGWKEGLWN